MASLTTAVPLIAFVRLHTSVLFGSLVSRPETVYLLPSTVNSSVSKPVALFSVPSYVLPVLLFATTVISYFVVRSLIVSLPFVCVPSV